MRPLTVDQTASWYRRHMAWPVEIADSRVVLPLGRGFTAFDTPAGYVSKVLVHLKALHSDDFSVPVLSDGQADGRAVFLAEADGTVLGQYQMPYDVTFLDSAIELVLPLRAPGPAGGNRSWRVPPNPAARWLLPGPAVLAAINAAAPPSHRWRPAKRAASRPARTIIG
ncbi:hypothetical protein [Lentzea sp. NPDC059081]|uniref:hypothetical protein n=1 Tax=Lentzea sp. NPDC059081 TaxID=3346719 RepID=UPI003686A6DC